ncbi:MAG TPA: BamA/TamA family outer membrane protein [Candidatus Krumholzibacteria bacterium]|nr:BamA/TamA family outer membrane protein [Candidatus Krumholzibacteria bacterium]
MLFLAPLLAGFLCIDSTAATQRFESEAYQWAQGRLIDTVYVHGNTRVKSIAIQRELESRQGGRLDARSVDRDQRYVGDLSPFATVAIHVEPVGADRCVLHVVVTERPTLLLKLIYPVLDYDFNTERVVYGVKWYDRNFRRRLESFSLDARRDNRGNDSAGASWSTAWIGWKHVGAGANLTYLNRQEASSEPGIVEQTRGAVSLSLPLTESRIAFSQMIFGMGLARNRIGIRGEETRGENLLSPSLGFRFDDRDGSIKPRNGVYFFVNVLANQVINGAQDTYYRLDNDIRYFRPLDESTVIGLRSLATIQLAEYPDYIRFGIGGPGTIRGYERSEFRSAHRWVQSLELRIMPWPKLLYRIPFIGISDFQLGLVAFVDTGIGWTESGEFHYDNFHSGFGMGLRLFSPIQDVLRVDFASTPRGGLRPYFSTGASF